MIDKNKKIFVDDGMDDDLSLIIAHIDTGTITELDISNLEYYIKNSQAHIERDDFIQKSDEIISTFMKQTQLSKKEIENLIHEYIPSIKK